MHVAVGLMRHCTRQLEAADAALLVCHEEAGRAEVKFALATGHVLRLARERLVDKVVKDRHGQIGACAHALQLITRSNSTANVSHACTLLAFIGVAGTWVRAEHLQA